MNKQIRQLAEQAEEYAVRVTTGDWEDGLAYQDLFNKKFAELIVGECIDTAFHRGHSDLDFLLKHFGVKE